MDNLVFTYCTKHEGCKVQLGQFLDFPLGDNYLMVVRVIAISELDAKGIGQVIGISELPSRIH